MQITSCEIQNSRYVQFYVTEEEYEKKKTKDIIQKYKNNKYNVAVFIAGKENYPEILKKIVMKQVELHKCES